MRSARRQEPEPYHIFCERPQARFTPPPTPEAIRRQRITELVMGAGLFFGSLVGVLWMLWHT